MTEVKKENAIMRYLRETLRELKRVSWPTREEALRLTGTVLLVTALMGLFLWLFDALFGLLLRGVIALEPLAIGLSVLAALAIAGAAIWIERSTEG